MTPLGPVYGAALGSGIGTLVQGGDLKDALKTAVIAGGIGGLTAGVKGGFGAKEAGKTFGEGFRGGVGDAFGNVAERFGRAPAPTATAGAPSTSQLQYQDYNVQPSIEQAGTSTAAGASPGTLGTSTAATQQSAGAGQVDAGVDQNILDSLRTRADSNIAERGYDYLTAAGKTPAELAEAAAEAKTKAMQSVLTDYGFGSIDQVNQLAKTGSDYAAKVAREAIAAGTAAAAGAGPNMLTKFGPSMALAGIGAAGAGFFDPPETDEDEEDDLYKDYKYTPSLYGFQAPPTYTLEDIRVPGREVGFAQGGLASLEEFPRRSGRIAGPGTERSDDVPAMLSDGEFVMTAKAVRGAGKGNRNNGMKNMYQMMRTFEASA